MQRLIGAVATERFPAPRYKAFGAFRFILALIVLLNHTGWVARGTTLGDFFIGARFGSAAVLMFFILSGYIITEAAVTFYAGRPRSFAQNRALKILPLFYAALVISVFVHVIALSQDSLLQAISFEGYEKLPRKMFGPVNFTFNFVSVLPFIPTYAIHSFFHTGTYLFVRYTWAVRVEVTFYLIVFLVMATSLHTAILRRYNLLLVLAGFVALVLFNEFVWCISNEFQYSPYFLLGALAYLGPKRIPHFWSFLLATSALLALHVTHFFTEALPLSDAWLAALTSAKRLRDFALFIGLFATFLLLTQVHLPHRFAALDRRLGDLSYSVYLNQYAVLVAYSALGLTPRVPKFAFLAIVTIAVIVAAIVQRLVERPLASVRDLVRGQRILVSAPEALRLGG